MRSNKTIIVTAAIALCLTLFSCGTKKSVTGGGASSVVKTGNADEQEAQRMSFLRTVYDNEAYANCLSSKIKFTLTSGKKDVTVAGSLKMKKDEVIRIQLTPFGLMEVGRLEFTKDYVLIMDRINHEYVKAAYTDVDFLSRNGLDFYALQALFWNKLYVPGTQKITDSSLKNFSVTFSESKPVGEISLLRNDMKYQWTANRSTGQILDVDVMYSSKANGTTKVQCLYDTFLPLGTKKFPANMTLKLNSDLVKSGKTMALNIAMGDFDTADGWETKTQVSSKYKKVSVEDVMNRLLSL